MLALLNSDVLDFALRTFLGSRMHIEVGDVRHLVVPVFSTEQKKALESFATRAIAAKRAEDSGKNGEALVDIEKELSDFVRNLYGIPRSARLWVVR
jgi:hypothetical protein